MPETQHEVFPKDPSKTYGLMELVKGTSPMVDKGPEDTVTSWPRLLILEGLLMLGTIVLLLVWSYLVNAPLRELANPDVTENPAKAPWYFLNLQELLLHMHPALAGVIIPTVMVILLMAVPYIDRDRRDIGIWFASKKGKTVAMWAGAYTFVLVVALVLFDEFVRVRSLVSNPWWMPGVVVPVGIILVLSVLLYLIIRRWRPNTREVLVGFFTAFVVTYIVLILFGTLFRGLGMRLIWPWNMPPGGLTF
ncbi:MAG: putative menaquinol-cytochrome reductase [Dehalococcoidia bacterium]|nr:putative menaquinol-cytochrome reductase [Dehalococcoidia bacterium]